MFGPIVCMLVMAQVGCVQRRMTIRTNPPGALVYVDDYEIGTTPVSTPFTYYGTRKIRVIKDGYETAVLYQRVRAPWYQIFPLDFVSENLVPFEIRDERFVDVQLTPARIVPRDELLGRADELRMATQQQGVMPAAAIALPATRFGQPAAPQATPFVQPTAPPALGTPPALSPNEPLNMTPIPSNPARTFPGAVVPPPGG